MNVADSSMNLEKSEENDNGPFVNLEKDGERERSVVDEEVLEKLMVNHSIGKSGRWEAIAKAAHWSVVLVEN
ncbi:Hypothetical predicted protein [Olea europaea subsp. europaea]|uniref:Myb-like domain-containing protein n=1 Tax=Olea europaea subsp. europaea TaxID=158383 RepID=A0A8S0RI64_OLEEU|nr:Hypothetical predicted protein [Olea europaea subsp. europaea]